MENDVHQNVTRAALLLAVRGAYVSIDQEFPWRKTSTPYRVFLAEFLLVRTRTDVVVRVFNELVDRYPDVHSLAGTSEEELGLILKPLGLPQRVPLLLRAAKHIEELENGAIPMSIKGLKAIPGMGDYTAGAVAAFAFGLPEVPADVNILRFLARLTGLPMEHPTKGSRELKALLPRLSVEQGGPQLQVLLDFTRVVCRPRKPNCIQCPLSEICQYFRETASEQST